MTSRERHKKLNSGLGAKLGSFLNNALVDADHLPGKSALRAQIEEEFGHTGLNLDKLAEVFTDFARRGQNRGARWGLRGAIDETVLKVVTKMEEEDRLIPVEENTDEEIEAAVEKAMDPYADRVGGEIERKHDAEIEKAREIVRKAGEAKSVQ